MRERMIATNLSISQLYQERDDAFHHALLALGRAYRARRLSDAKFETRTELLHNNFERAATNAQIVMFVDACQKIIEEFEAI